MTDGYIQQREEPGKKFDGDKPRTDLLPPLALMQVAEILTFGSTKYGDRNWEKGMSWGRLIGAALRHIYKWMAGQDFDEETGKNHLAHAACCVLMLLHYTIEDAGMDDRK